MPEEHYLDILYGEDLDRIGVHWGEKRYLFEADDLYRERLKAVKGPAGLTLSVVLQAIEREHQRANDAVLAKERWKRTAARQEALFREEQTKTDRWRKRCAELESERDDLVEKLCALREGSSGAV